MNNLQKTIYYNTYYITVLYRLLLASTVKLNYRIVSLGLEPKSLHKCIALPIKLWNEPRGLHAYVGCSILQEVHVNCFIGTRTQISMLLHSALPIKLWNEPSFIPRSNCFSAATNRDYLKQ